MDRQKQDTRRPHAETAAADRQVRAIGGTVLLWLAFFLLAPLPLHAEIAQVHVDHSVTARDLLARCSQAARTDPARATLLLDELLDRYADQLVEVEPGLYRSVGLIVRQQVGQWPEPALEHLQQAWQSPAAEQWQPLADSPDFPAIERFARRYFFTAVGAQAAERAARLALEAAQPDLARMELDDLQRYHPQRRQQTDRWQGLQAVTPPPATDPSPPDLDEKTKLAVLWQANLTDRPGYALNRQKMPPHWLPMPMVLARPDLVLTQWDRHCLAFEPGSGAMLWDYYPLSNRMAVRAGVSGPTMPRRPVLASGRVYVVNDVALPQEESAPLAAVHALACLDADTGDPYWIRAAGEMISREVPTILDGTPVVDAGRVYIAARIARTAVYNEVFLLQIDAYTGNLLNRTHLFDLGRVEHTTIERIKPVRLGIRGGILYVVSSAGAAGAIDAQSLRPIWVHSFKPETVSDAKDADVPEVSEPAVPALWADEPLLVDEKLLVPADASLQVLDRLSGQVLQSIPLPGPISALSLQPGTPGQVALIAKRTLCIVDIHKGTILRKFDLGKSNDAIGGLASLSGGRLLICTEEQLRVLHPDGTISNLSVGFLPAGIPAIVQGRLYVGGNGYLACVTDGEKPLAVLQLEMKRSSDPLMALRTGEVALRANEPDLAIRALRVAMQRGAADVAKVGEPVVQRLFDTCMTFARQYTGKRSEEGRRIAEQLLEIAGQCPAPIDGRLQLYVALADLRLIQKRPADAIAAWQKILAEEVLRTAPLAEAIGGREGTRAGTWAYASIDEAIERYGREVYSRFDDQAAQLLQSDQREALEDLLQRYPNSKHVPAALLRIGQGIARSGNARAALDPLRKAATLAEADPATRTQAMLELARAYETLGNIEATATWMARLMSQSAEMTFEQGGRKWTARQYAADLADRLPRSPSAARHIDLPLQPGPSQTFEDAVHVLDSPGAATARTGHRASLIWSPGWLQGMDPRAGEPAWKHPYKSDAQPTLLATDDTRLLLYDRYRVTAIDAAAGQTLWAWTGKGPDPTAPGVDPESLPTIQAIAATTDSILLFTADGQATCLQRSSGAIRWQRPAQPAYVAGLAVSQGLAVYRANQANTIVYRVLDVVTGQDVSLFRPTRDVPAESVEILPAAMVMLVGTNTIETYDAYSGSPIWQIEASGQFRPAISLRKDTAYYIADGERRLIKIDVLTGQALWRAITTGRTGSSVGIFADGPLVWLIDERGAHLIDAATGKPLQTVMLPAELGAHTMIRSAAVCDAGVLCLAAKRRGGEPSDTPPAMLVLFTYKAPTATASLVARLDEATGLLGGWDIADNAILIAAGNKLLTLRSQDKASR